MNTENQQDTSPEQTDGPEVHDAATSRRRFISAGAGGVILTLASGSGMAAVCTMPSGALSGPTIKSRSPGAAVCRGGKSPGYWKKEGRYWYGVSRDTKFGTIFSCRPGSDYEKTTLGVMITQQNEENKFDDQNLGCHFTAMYLNIHSRLITFMTLEQLKMMWVEASMTKGYVPTDGVLWTIDELTTYFKRTYDEPFVDDKY